MNLIKKIGCIVFAAVVMAVFAGCSAKSEEKISLNSAEMASIITEKGGEMAEYNPPVELKSEELPEDIKFLAQMYGWDLADFEEGSVSCSLMITQAYFIGIAKPREGKTETVIGYFQSYKDAMIRNFDRYLEDQYEIAKEAVIEEYQGYVIFVMSEDAVTIADQIKTALK